MSTGAPFTRPREGFRFRFGGLKVNEVPDAIGPTKYALAVNVREVGDSSIRTRPGQTQKFTTGNSIITDMRAYLGAANAAGDLSDVPRYLVRDAADNVWLDTGSSVGSLAATAYSGAAMIPFRPAASPTPWMYIANGADYQKFSSPDLSNVVTQQKVGIAEPQTPPDAFVSVVGRGEFPNALSAWTHGGTAGAGATSARVADTSGAVVADPASGGVVNSVQVSNASSYQRYMEIYINSVVYLVLDVFPRSAGYSISAIRYFSGTTGRCIIVPRNLAAGPGTEGQSILEQNLLSTLRRGALIAVGAETCIVWSITEGPDGTICIETSTALPHTTADGIAGLPAIQVIAVGGGPAPTPGHAISDTELDFTVTAGVGTETSPSAGAFTYGGFAFQPDDYFSFALKVDDLTKLNEIKLLFDVGDGSFTQNFYYYTVRPSDIASAVANASTQLASAQSVIQRAVIDEENAAAAHNQLKTASSAQLVPGSGQWGQFFVPISAFTRVGGDDTKSFLTMNAMQYLVNASATVHVSFADTTLFGSFQPDVGDVGEPYRYRVRPRSMVTGVKGNPSPSTRYGVSARRGKVVVNLPSAAYDGQIDTWDVFRFGGSVTSWRFIGSTPSSNSTFTDNFSDDAAQGGDELEFDNLEPWPSVDVPNNGTASTVCGTVAVVSTTDTDITYYLPGTLVQLGTVNVYTLWTRPVSLGGTNYLLQFVENAGAGTNLTYNIQEPLLANQALPYLWGPDVDGTVFAVGNPQHPGTLYFSKPFAPDSAPDTNNIEISPPSEALLGGCILDGLSYVASTERWWALYPQPDNPAQKFNFVQQPIARGLAAPYGVATDGKAIYWWAKDGIWSSSKGSLTDADLYSLFPHEGVVGNSYVYAATGQTVPAPDYSRAGTFRLTYANYYLYAVYQDSTGAYNVLVYDTRRGAWSLDVYGGAGLFVTAFYHPEQQAGSLASAPALYDELIMAIAPPPKGLPPKASVATQTVNANDITGAIHCALATFEYDGGDIRAPKQWGDFWVDCIPAAQNTGHTTASGEVLMVTPVSLGAAIAPAVSISPAVTRQRVPASVNGILVSDFVGLLFTWADDFLVLTIPTRLYAWQPSLTVQPAATIAYKTFGTSFGLDGYKHLRQVALAYVATAPVTLTIGTYDGQSPAVITLPGTGGAYQKTLFPVGPNKGLLYTFQFASAEPFQIFEDDSEYYVGAWLRDAAYAVPRNLGGREVEGAAI